MQMGSRMHFAKLEGCLRNSYIHSCSNDLGRLCRWNQRCNILVNTFSIIASVLQGEKLCVVSLFRKGSAFYSD